MANVESMWKRMWSGVTWVASLTTPRRLLPSRCSCPRVPGSNGAGSSRNPWATAPRSEEHTSELQSQSNLVCRLLLEKKKKIGNIHRYLNPRATHLYYWSDDLSNADVKVGLEARRTAPHDLPSELDQLCDTIIPIR